MDVTATLDAPVAPDALFPWVEDLTRYPEWLSIVPRAVPEPGADDAWRIDLRARIGPLARSKRLRMVRTQLDSPSTVVFERQEDDGQDHSSWRLRAEVTPVEVAGASAGSRLTMHLHYGGRLFEPLVERLLRDEIERSRQRLLALVV
jgi:hypothetical protein